MEVDSRSEFKAIIEAALFASGKTLSARELASMSKLSEDEAGALADDLAREYLERRSGIEIRSFEGRYSMQVRPGLAQEVLSVAPKEIDAPLIRTLAIIAYKQPIRQSDLAEIRGNKSYAHVKELEEMGLISAAKQGRTKVITTTKGFADYFGLDDSDPKSIRHALLNRRKSIGVTKMYESLASRMGLDYISVNPYRPSEFDLEKLKEIDLLVAAPGYLDRIRPIYSGEVIEAGVRTFSQLKESIERIAATSEEHGNVEPLISEIDSLLRDYRERAKGLKPIKALTPMIEDIAKDLRIPLADEGLTAAPDSSGLDAQIVIPVHQPYDMDIIERIKQRCEAMIKGLKA